MTEHNGGLIHELLHIVEHTVSDAIKLLPFLFIAYFIVEFVEHKSSEKSLNIMKKVGRFGAIPGALFGIIPQCGFSVAAANLFTGGVITIGTLISVFLATSDEALILLLADGKMSVYAGWLIVFKIAAGIVFGLIFDFVFANKTSCHQDEDFCKNCNCENGIIKAALTHTVSIFLYIVVATFIINIFVEFGEEVLNVILLNGSFLQPLLTALVGFIPGCAVSITFYELFAAGQLSFGSILAGLFTNAGIGLFVLFKTYAHKKEILKVMLYMYVVSAVSGMVVNLFIK